MGSRLVLLLGFLATLLLGPPPVLVLGQDQDLRESDALCTAEGCLVLRFQRRTFLESWRSCKEGGGSLATLKRKEDSGALGRLFSAVEMRHSRVRVWIGLQRQPRRCSTHPLRGFSWTTGDQDTDYTNWRGEDSPGACLAPRCVAVGYDAREQGDNLKWVDGPCAVHVDGYLCHYAYSGMCPPLWSEGTGKALYATPFRLLSTLLTHVPPGTLATLPCPSDSEGVSSVSCTLSEDGSAAWSRDPPYCSDPALASHHRCQLENGGCEHFCRAAGGHVFCECAGGYRLADNEKDCELLDVCEGAPCEFECLALPDRYRCACPEGYMLAPDEHGCVDVDECLQSPCEQLCVNSPGSFECRCREGYLPDEGGGCEDADECAEHPCEHACEDTVGSHVCHCHLGFSPVPRDASRCQDTDECRIAGTCQHMCVNFEGGFQCYCQEGYRLLSDLSTCQKVEDDDYDQSAASPSLAWATHPPGLSWEQYEWGAEDPPEDRLTEVPNPPESGVIWVSTSHDYPEVLRPSAQRPVRVDPGGEVSSPPPPTTEPQPMTTPHWYEGGDGDNPTAASPLLSTSTLSEEMWNWGKGVATMNPEDGTLAPHLPRVPSFHGNPEELPGDPTNRTRPGKAVAPTRESPGKSPTGGAGGVDPEGSGSQTQSTTWQLLAILVPVGIFAMLMVVLGIVCCACVGGQLRHQKAEDCFRGMAGAPSAPVGVASQV